MTAQIPRIDEPYKLWERFVQFLEQYRKPPTTVTDATKKPEHLLE
jgi:hypothetical protein